MKKEYLAPTVIAVRMSAPMNLCQTSNNSLKVYNYEPASKSGDDVDRFDDKGYYIGDIY